MAVDPKNTSNGLGADEAQLTDGNLQQVHNQLMREKVEPSEGFPPMPLFILFMFATVVFGIGVYFVKHIAGFRWDVYDPNYDPRAAVDTAPRPAFDAMRVGARIYVNNCQQCHQVDGAGVPPSFPPLAGVDWVTETRIRPTAILLHGLTGEIEVNGVVYRGNMPAFGGILSDRDIGAVLTYIRASWGNQAGAITEEHVQAIRAKVGNRALPWTAGELKTLAPMPELTVEMPASEEAEETGEAEESPVEMSATEEVAESRLDDREAVKAA
ncbi:MAG: c-type cytochrome [Puniceicoccaceae bacterium]